MFTRTSVLLIAFLAVGVVAIAWGDHPSFMDQSGQFCDEPRPEHIRSYYLQSVVGSEIHEVLIPAVEGTTGFIITDIICISCELWEDSGEAPIRVAGLPSAQSAVERRVELP